MTLPTAAAPPGQPPRIIGRAQWGADEWMRCGKAAVRQQDPGRRWCTTPRAATTTRPGTPRGSSDRSTTYHTRTLGWCDIAYNALVDKYGQVFEGRAGGIDRPVEGSTPAASTATPGAWRCSATSTTVPPTPIQLRTTARLLGWRLGHGRGRSAGHRRAALGGRLVHQVPGRRDPPTLPTIFTHRDVGNTECPGNAAYALMDQIRDIAARFNEPPGPEQLAETLRGGAIFAQMGFDGRHEQLPGRADVARGVRRGLGPLRHLRTGRGVLVPGKWGRADHRRASTRLGASLGFERGALGLPTSAEIAEPLWIVQNFQHGTLNFDRENATVTRVIDGVPVELPPPPADRAPIQLERFTPPINPVLTDYSHQRSSTRATPSSALGVVTSSAAATASGCALPIATPRPAQPSIGTSLGMSPNATTSAAVIPAGAPAPRRRWPC